MSLDTQHPSDFADPGLHAGGLFIGGEWLPGAGIPVMNPSTAEVLAEVPDATVADALRAVDAAQAAAAGWRATPARQRSEILRRWFHLMTDHAEELARLISLENGKALPDARGEVAYAAEFFRWYAEEAVRIAGEFRHAPSGANHILVDHDPIGIAVLITPWNFPAAMITRKVAPAFAAGCTVVLKPASQTPFTALALAALALEAGVPPGVFSVVTGANDVVGPALTGSPLIRKLSFTGSTPVGRLLAEQSAPTLKRLSMELGGAAPLIVFDDADLDLAVAQTIAGKFRCSGQTCVCPNRVYVQNGLHDAYLERLTARVATLKVGGPFEDGVQVGPLIDAKGLDKVERHVRHTVEAGGRVLTGGARHERGGTFFQPTVLAGGDEALFRREETFGPVVPVFSFETEDEVVRLANDSEYGLASYVFTRDLDRAFRVSRAIEAGMTGLNVGLMSNAANPFGGVKQSGYGREGSVYGIDEYLALKSITVGLG